MLPNLPAARRRQASGAGGRSSFTSRISGEGHVSLPALSQARCPDDALHLRGASGFRGVMTQLPDLRRGAAGENVVEISVRFRRRRNTHFARPPSVRGAGAAVDRGQRKWVWVGDSRQASSNARPVDAARRPLRRKFQLEVP